MADQKKPMKLQMPTKKAADKIAAAKGHEIIKKSVGGSQSWFSSSSSEQPSSYSVSDVVRMSLTKNAQWTGGLGANVIFTQPMFFSPLHTPQNWQIASKRREIYQWMHLPGTVILLDDYTYQAMDEVDFDYKEVIEDTITGGHLFDGIDYPLIMNSEGEFTKPPRFSRRDCENKRCFSLKAQGYWRDLKITEEHHIFVLDGDLYRKKKKVDGNTKYRVKKGIKPNGVKKVKIPNTLIKRVQSQEVKSNDYLLTPVPDVGKESLPSEKSWLIGFCVADGCFFTNGSSCKVAFTGESGERSLLVSKEYLENNFDGTISSVPHGEGKGWRVNATTQKAYKFFTKYIQNKKTNKKFSKAVFDLDKESRLQILGGYIDGDGSFSKDSEQIIANCYSKDLADQIYWLCLSCGIRCCLTRHPLYGDYYDTSSEWCYRIRIPSSDIPLILPYMRSDKVPSNFSAPDCRELKFFYEENGQKYFAQPIDCIKQFYHTGEGFDIEMTNERRALVAGGYICSNSRFYYENEPKVAAGVDFYSQFSINSFKLECKSRKVLKFFERLVEKIQLTTWFKRISHEYFLLGDVFVWLDIDCPHCRGTQVNPDSGERCNHPDGTIGKIRILNPDWIEVIQSPVGGEPQFVMLPDEELYKIVTTRRPEHIYNQLSPAIRQFVASKQPFPLSNRSCSHIKHRGVAYGVYGESLLRRLFTTLAYKTKLMTANWIVAERLILPIRVVKVGDKDRPAGPDDIADVTNQLAQIANDPNLTLVTHHAFEYDWYGACYDEETLFLTKDKGWMRRSDLINEDVSKIEIMVFDPSSGQMRYETPLAYHEFDYDGQLVDFCGREVNISVTPNHKMLGYKRDKKTAYVMEARNFAEIGESDRYVKCTAEFISSEKLSEIDVCGYKVPVDDFARLAGYYLAEGHCEFNEQKRRYLVSVAQSPSKNPDICEDIDSCFERCGFDFSKYEYDGRATAWNILRKNVAQQFKQWFGDSSYNKKIPSFLKNMPTQVLKILIDAYNDGDSSWHQYKNAVSVQNGTTSRQLAEDLLEVMFKAGLSPSLSDHIKKTKDCEQWVVNCNMEGDGVGNSPRIKDNHISYRDYKGKVWCFTTSTGFFVTQRQGKIAIQGNSGKIHNINAELELIGKEILDGLMINQALLNGEMASYTSAQVGIETMIQRLHSWRNELAEWAHKNIFLPIAQMQGFIDEKETDEAGETVYIYPRIKWDDLRLRDNTNKLQAMMQLHDKGVVSTQTLLENFELDYDQEIRRIREEQVQAGPGGQVMGGGAGGMGGMGMNMGGMGGGGGAPPMGDMGGMGAPGGAPGMGGPPGMGGSPGGAPGGMGAPGGAPGGMGAAAAAAPDKIYKPGQAPKKKEEEVQPIQPHIVQFTKPEMKLYGMLQQMDIPFQLYAQFKQPVPGQQQPFIMDFAFPQIGIDLEADGSAWHEDEEDVLRDKKRDLKLASLGWRVLRFPEAAINERMDEIQQVVHQNIVEAIKEKTEMKKKAQSLSDMKYEVMQDQDGDIWRSIIVTKSKPVLETGIKEG